MGLPPHSHLLACDGCVGGGDRSTCHKVSTSPPLTPRALQAVIGFLSKLGTPTLMPIAAILIGYFAFLRQSNLLSPRPDMWGGPHTLRRKDIRLCSLGLRILINSSKTIDSPAKAVELLVPKIPNSPMCPVSAWLNAASAVPASGSAPAFLSSAEVPLDTPTLTTMLRMSLRVLDIPAADSYTLRSLRRGAAQACHSSGVPLAAIKAQGTWVSSAVFSYVPRQAPSAAPLALASFFGRASGPADRA